MARTIFRGANLLDGRNPAQPDSALVVDGERIAYVGPDAGAPRAQPGDREVALAGRTLMPGLISTHYHSTYDGITIMPEPLGLEAPPGYLAIVAAKNVQLALACGFTSLVSAGAINDDIDAQLALAIERGVIPGPRLVPGSRGFDTTGGYTDTERWWWELGNHGAQVFCDGPDEFRKAVRREIKRGARMIKLFPSGGHGVDEAREELSFSFDELRACVETAHARGARLRAHCPWKKPMLECIRAGVDVIDHGDRIDDEVIEAMLRAGSFLVPSMFFIQQMLHDGGNLVAATAVQQAPIRADFENIRRMLPRANEAGVKLCIGDDYGIVILPHGRYAEELEFYVKEVGIPPLDVLRWATVHGAELMGRGGELGSLEVGKLADLLVVDGDPSQDIALLRERAKLLAILKGGVFQKDALHT